MTPPRRKKEEPDCVGSMCDGAVKEDQEIVEAVEEETLSNDPIIQHFDDDENVIVDEIEAMWHL